MDNQERIDRYLRNEMSETEHAYFQVQRLKDPNLMREMEWMKAIQGSIRLYVNRQIKSQLQEIYVPDHRRTMIWIGASLLAVLFAWLLFRSVVDRTTFHPDGETLFANHFARYDWRIGTRSEQADGELFSIQRLYSAGAYRESMSVWSEWAKDEERPFSNEVRLAMANAAILTNQKQKAFDLLQNIIHSKDPYYIDHAYWYLALLYIKHDEISESRPLLQKLIDESDADHHLEAIDLLREMNKR